MRNFYFRLFGVQLIFILLFFIGGCGGDNDGKELFISGVITNYNKNSIQTSLSETSSGILINRDGESLSTNPTYFTLTDVKSGKVFKLSGNWSKQGDKSYQQKTFLTEEKIDITINYSCLTKKCNITLLLESFQDKDRGWDLQYHLPLRNDITWKWGVGPSTEKIINSFNSIKVDPESASWYPLTTISNSDFFGGGVALGIPILKPVMGRFSSTANELIAHFSLGTSPLTKNKNLTTISFDMWSISGGGFREALSDYYSYHNNFFKRVVTKTGLWLPATPDKVQKDLPFLFHEHGNIFFSMGDSSAKPYIEQLEIDKIHNIMTLPYLHIGQMSRIKLDRLPISNNKIDKFLKEKNVLLPPQQLKKYSTLFTESDVYNWLNALKLSSTKDNADNANIRIRETITKALTETGDVIRIWDTIGKQVSFVINPNPIIKNGHGDNMLKWVKKIIEKEPSLSGFYVDSLSGWTNYKNYRREHFYYSEYPLASDKNGNVYLPNAWGHISFLIRLKRFLHSKNKILMGNGYRGGVDSFFVSSIPDVLGREDQNNVNRISLFGRVLSGGRPHLKLSAHVDDMSKNRLEKYINSSLALGVLPSSWGSYFSKKEWLNSDESFSSGNGGLNNYSLHKEQWSKINKVIDAYRTMKWQPENLTLSNNSIHIERFLLDSKNMILTVYRTNKSKTNDVSIMLSPLLSKNINLQVGVIDLISNKKYSLKYKYNELSLDIKLDKSESSLSVLKLRCMKKC